MIKQLLLALTAAALLTTAFVYIHKQNHTSNFTTDEDLETQWNSFKRTYGKKYADLDYEQYRIQIFAKNLASIKGESTFGVTQFMDLSAEEFKAQYLTLKVQNKDVVPASPAFNDENVEVDWLSKGAVTPVKNQGQCGSCWSFSATGGVEGAVWRKTGKLVSLSEQFLVDCSHSGNEGCNGGLMDTAFKYIEQNGIPTEDSYPYTAVDGTCKSTTGSYHISDFKDVVAQDCNDLVKAIQVQPVSIAVDANAFQFYTSGILSKCGTQLDHGVLLVGYSSEGKYWKVKNSWGTSWGEQGFIRLAAGNTCGLCNMASYPSV